MPATKTVGDTVIGGTINQAGMLHIRATKSTHKRAMLAFVARALSRTHSRPFVQLVPKLDWHKSFAWWKRRRHRRRRSSALPTRSAASSYQL